METTTRYENLFYPCSESELHKPIEWAKENGYELVSATRDQHDKHVFGSCPWWLFFKRPIVSAMPPTLTEVTTPPPPPAE